MPEESEPRLVEPAKVEPKKWRPSERTLEPPPSNAWLRPQPYDPTGGSGYTTPEQSPDAWLKPRPYNPGGFLPDPPYPTGR
jgi:hypothetical protein